MNIGRQRRLCLRRGIRGSCPRCGHHPVFRSHYRLHEWCPACGLALEHEDGWGLGAIPLNYSIACVFWILPIALLFLIDGLSLGVALFLAGSGAVILPFLTYRFSKALWVGIYYAILPHEAVPREPKRRERPD
ncbi:MAG: DUF983 domain-containing protein [Oceanipulchritudo sp.]